jgi:tetratricopeptide (TPR) repeat protein
MQGSRRGWFVLLLLAALLGGSALLYAPSLDHPFVRDDQAHLLQEPHWTGEPATWWRAWWEPFWYRSPESGLFRPFTTFTLQVSIDGTPEPAALRPLNLALHALCAWLTGLLILTLCERHLLAALAALVLVAHPLLSEPVLEVVSRAESQAACGVLAAAWLLGRRSRSAAVAAGLCWFLALASKESAAGALPLLLAIALRPPPITAGATAGPRIPWTLPVLALGVALALFLTLRGIALGDRLGLSADDISPLDNPLARAGTGERLATACGLLPRYLGLLLWPHPLSADYSLAAIPIAASLGAAGWTGVLLLVAGFAWLIRAWQRDRRLEWIGLLLAAGCYAPVSQFLAPVGTILAERVAYLPTIGLVLAASGLVARGLPGLSPALLTVGTTTAITLAIVLAWLTRERVDDWRDERTLYEAALVAQPDSARVHCVLAATLREEGELDRAEVHALEALRIHPPYLNAHTQLALILAVRGDVENATAHFREAASQPKSSGDDVFNYATAVLRTNAGAEERNKAESLLRTALAKEPNRADLVRLLQEMQRR